MTDGAGQRIDSPPQPDRYRRRLVGYAAASAAGALGAAVGVHISQSHAEEQDPRFRQPAATSAGADVQPPFSSDSAQAQPTPPIDFDPLALERIDQRARQTAQLRSLVIARHGRIALAEAYRGPGLSEPSQIKSVSKTLVATLTGIAIDQGKLSATSQTLGSLVPGLIPAGADARVADIQLEHLLSMQSGLARTSGPRYGEWVNSDDWVAYVLSQPMVAAPGGRMLYSTGSYHVLGAVLSMITGRSLLALAREWLGDPLNIEIPAWTRDPQGRYLGGNEMAMSSMALLRLGEIARQGGQWQGQSVVSAAWIDASWEPRTRSPYSGHDYGYGWFIARVGANPLYYARGYGGQLIYVLPRLAMTVVVTSDPGQPARSGGYIDELHDLLANVIVPAATPVIE